MYLFRPVAMLNSREDLSKLYGDDNCEVISDQIQSLRFAIRTGTTRTQTETQAPTSGNLLPTNISENDVSVTEVKCLQFQLY
jgi:predicted RNA-binding protein